MALTADLFDRWIKTWSKAGLDAPEDLFDNLVLRYSDSRRAYHNTRHLSECMAALDKIGDVSASAELAVWFHDAVYDVRASDSERRSADFATKSLAAAGIREVECFRVRGLILLTQHRGGELKTPDAKCVVDADLSILGAEWDRFSEYGRQIRSEYAHVPDDLFRTGRLSVLRRFIGMDSVFHTDLFREELEDRARENLRRAIEELEPGA